MPRSWPSLGFLVGFLAACVSTSAFQPPVVNISSSMSQPFSPAAAAVRVPPAMLRVDSSLVLIPAHVTTHDGTSVTDLARENFQLFEDGVEQPITHFSQDDAPISIGLLLDTSGSMENKIAKSSDAAATFMKTANSDDEFFLVEFNERPKLTVPFTPDSGLIFKRIARSRPFGRTSLLDAIHLAMLQMKNARNLRKAIVILSDGGDNRSRFTAGEVKNDMLESDVQLYAMGVFDLDDLKKHPVEEQNGPILLDELAEETGGRLFRIENLNELGAISERISRELRSEYLLGYSPSNGERDGKYRSVQLKLNAPSGMKDLRSYYRHGYYAPIR
jgi:Ca-activated chloride channel family protein